MIHPTQANKQAPGNQGSLTAKTPATQAATSAKSEEVEAQAPSSVNIQVDWKQSTPPRDAVAILKSGITKALRAWLLCFYQRKQISQIAVIVEATMSSREIAELTNKQHKHVMVDIGKMLLELEEDEPSFRRIYFDSMNREQREYRINRELTDTLLTGYSAKARRAVITRWRDLEYGNATPASQQTKPYPMVPSKEFRALYGIARLIGLDKNVSAISANQAVAKLTGVNVLNLLGQTHLENQEQKLYFTPTEIGARLGGLSGRKVNMLLAEAGLQARHGEKWLPLQKDDGMFRVLDTGKAHADGSMVQQIKWADDVLDLVHQPKELAKEEA